MSIRELTRQQANTLYRQVLKDADTFTMRRLCREDLFFFLLIGCKRKDIDHDWLYDRCREVEADPDGYLDLWAREHYKSTIITFGKTIQDILLNSELTFGIFSHTRPIAKSFLSQIKRELEANKFLQDLFPDVLYKEPHKESPCWSLDNGIVVKRKGNPKECTVEAWGLVDGQPTSKHFAVLVYDDVVTKESVTTPEQIAKVTDAVALSYNLGAKEGRRRYIGTRYHQNDTYKTIIDRKSAIVREHTPTDLGKEDFDVLGKPVLLDRVTLLKKREDMGPYIYACQMLQNPHADRAMGFHPDWLRYYLELKDITGWNFYFLSDAASEKKKTSDYTVQVVIGLAPDGNYYLVDAVRDRMNLTQRTKSLFRLVKKWMPKGVGYEKYGKDSDIEHIEYVQEHENYRFAITELGGSMPKNDRIRRLVPIFESGRFYIPHHLIFTSVDGKSHDFVREFINEEYTTFPVSTHDDMLDCMSRIVDEDMSAVFPNITKLIPEAHPLPNKEYDPLNRDNRNIQQGYQPPANISTRRWRDLMVKK